MGGPRVAPFVRSQDCECRAAWCFTAAPRRAGTELQATARCARGYLVRAAEATRQLVERHALSCSTPVACPARRTLGGRRGAGTRCRRRCSDGLRFSAPSSAAALRNGRRARVRSAIYGRCRRPLYDVRRLERETIGNAGARGGRDRGRDGRAIGTRRTGDRALAARGIELRDRPCASRSATRPSRSTGLGLPKARRQLADAAGPVPNRRSLTRPSRRAQVITIATRNNIV